MLEEVAVEAGDRAFGQGCDRELEVGEGKVSGDEPERRTIRRSWRRWPDLVKDTRTGNRQKPEGRGQRRKRRRSCEKCN